MDYPFSMHINLSDSEGEPSRQNSENSITTDVAKSFRARENEETGKALYFDDNLGAVTPKQSTEKEGQNSEMFSLPLNVISSLPLSSSIYIHSTQLHSQNEHDDENASQEVAQDESDNFSPQRFLETNPICCARMPNFRQFDADTVRWNCRTTDETSNTENNKTMQDDDIKGNLDETSSDTERFDEHSSGQKKYLDCLWGWKTQFLERIGEFFGCYVGIVSKFPWTFIITSTLVCLCFGIGFLFRKEANSGEEQYALPYSEAYKTEELFRNVFKDSLSRNQLLLVHSKNNTNLMTKAFLDKLWVFHQGILNITVTYKTLEAETHPDANTKTERKLMKNKILLHEQQNDALPNIALLESVLDSEDWFPYESFSAPSRMLGRSFGRRGWEAEKTTENNLTEATIDLRSATTEETELTSTCNIENADPKDQISGLECRAPLPSDTWGFQNLCVKDFKGVCLPPSGILFMYSEREDYGSPIDYPERKLLKTHENYTTDMWISPADLVLNEDSNAVVEAPSLLLKYSVSDKPEVQNIAQIWEQELLSYVLKHGDDLPNAKVHIKTENSLRQELSASTSMKSLKDHMLVCGTVLLLFGYTAVASFSRNLKKAKLMSALMGGAAAALGYVGGCGLCYLMGIQHTNTAAATPFLVLGIGVDDMFVILNSYTLTYMHTNVGQRLHVALKDCGLSITITTLTNLIAFAIGASSPYLAIRNFCILTAVGLFMGYVMVLTFFLAWLCIDAKREERNTKCSFVCKSTKSVNSSSHGEIVTPRTAARRQHLSNYASSTFKLVALQAAALDAGLKNNCLNGGSSGKHFEEIISEDVYDEHLNASSSLGNKERSKTFRHYPPYAAEDGKIESLLSSLSVSFLQSMNVQVSAVYDDEYANAFPALMKASHSSESEHHLPSSPRSKSDIALCLRCNTSLPYSSPTCDSKDDLTEKLDKIQEDYVHHTFCDNCKSPPPAPPPLSQTISHTKRIIPNLSLIPPPPQIVSSIELKSFSVAAALPTTENETSGNWLGLFSSINLRRGKTFSGITNKKQKSSLHSFVSPSMKITFESRVFGKKDMISISAADLAEPKGNVGRKWRAFFISKYGWFITRPIVKLLVLLLFACYMGISIWGCTLLKRGLDVRKLAEDDSYLAAFFNAQEDSFVKYGDPVQIFFPESIKWYTKGFIEKYHEHHTFLANADYSMTIKDGLLMFFQSTLGEDLPEDDPIFCHEMLSAWLSTPTGSNYGSDFLWDEKKTYLKAWKLVLVPPYLNNSEEQGFFMATIRSDLQKFGLGSLAYNRMFLYYESDRDILPNTLSNMGFAALSMLFVSFLLLSSLWCGVLVIIIIVTIDTGVIGLMCFWHLPLNMLTMVNLVISIGFSVDYSTHICHTFCHCVGKTRNLRAIETLVLMGNPILHGAFSTQLAVIALSFSSSYILRVFFKMMTLVLVLGALHGIVLLPVILSLIGPSNGNPNEDKPFNNFICFLHAVKKDTIYGFAAISMWLKRKNTLRRKNNNNNDLENDTM